MIHILVDCILCTLVICIPVRSTLCMEMGILSGLRTFACEGISNCGVMFGSGGDKCAAFASLESV